MKNDYNIEFAHIYSDQKFGEEQAKSAEILKQVTEKLNKENKSFATAVLVDELHPKDKKLDTNAMLEQLRKIGAGVDFVANESDFQEIARKLTSEPKNTKSCPYLMAAWYLYRLGHFSEGQQLFRKTGNKEVFHSDKLIMILPEKYKQVERKALKIIKNSPYKAACKNIEHIFF